MPVRPIPSLTEASKPLVSVLVPTYQHAPFIEECLESILMQETSFPVEVLVGEDESTDGTREISQRIAAEHPDRIRLFLRSRKDVLYIQGQPTGRANNFHLYGQAKGKYLITCEGDDYWTDPLKLQKQVDALEGHPEFVGCFNWVQVRTEPDGTLGKIYGDHEGRTLFTVEDTIAIASLFHTSGFLFRRSALPAFPAWSKKVLVSFDMALFALVASKGGLLCLPEVMGVYRKHDGGITMTKGFRSLRFHYNRLLLWLYVDRHLKYRYTQRVQEVFLFHWRRIYWNSFRRERFKYLGRLMKQVPQWFLVHPRFALARLREAAFK